MIHIEHVSKTYDNVQALQKINLTIPAGTCLGLVGPNGAGKSTLMKILAHVIREYEGVIRWNDVSTHSLGYIPQDICLEETLSASTNLRFYGKIYGLSGKELANRENEILERTGLVDRANDKVKTFSGGMKRRLNIGCALMHQPQLIIMDEPTVGVDPQSRRHIFQLIRQLKEEGKTVIYASHYMEEIETLCDYIALIDRGKIIEKGSKTELLSRYAKPAVYIKGEIPDEWFSDLDFQQKDGGWIIHTTNPLSLLADLAKRCEAENITPIQLSLMQSKLEDVFFTLTGTALRDNLA